jgi:hypothetical protein
MSESSALASPATTPTHAPVPNADALRNLWHWFLPCRLLAGVARHGNSTWRPDQLVIQALCWAWSSAPSLTDAFDEAAQCCRALWGAAPVSTYQGLMAALVKWSPALIHPLIVALRQRAQDIGGRFWRVGPWVPIAFDGSRSTAPRTTSNETAYRAPNHGRGRTAKYRKKKTQGMRRTNNQKRRAQLPEPQVWMTLLWHMGMRLPWAWRLGPSNASERDHVMTMLADEGFPARTLFCGDAGFIGYPLWAQIQTRGHEFVVRTGANVHLLVESLNGLIVPDGQDQLVLCWPQDARRAGLPPLRLRLIHTRIKRTPVWLLTSVLDPEQLTREQALDLYRMRWGVEVEFRGLKQTLNRAHLRCRNDARVLVELEWSLLAMAVAELWALKEQMSGPSAARGSPVEGVPTPGATPAAVGEPWPDGAVSGDVPGARSLARTMRALRWCLRNVREACEPGRGLADRLREAVTDGYMRSSSKRARYRPLNPDKKPLGEPKLRVLTTEEKEKLQDMPLNLAA